MGSVQFPINNVTKEYNVYGVLRRKGVMPSFYIRRVGGALTYTPIGLGFFIFGGGVGGFLLSQGAQGLGPLSRSYRHETSLNVGHGLLGGYHYSTSLFFPSQGKLNDLVRLLTLFATDSLISISISLYIAHFSAQINLISRHCDLNYPELMSLRLV